MEAYNSEDDWEVLGAGAYGKVYKATVKATGDMVAIKKIDPDIDDIEGLHPELIREVTLLRRINPHPYVVQFDEAIPVMVEGKDKRHRPTMYLVFEYVGKRTLEELVSESSLEPNDIRDFLYQILSGVAHCHSHSVLHRDLKTAYILVDEETRTIKIADLGSGRGFTVGPQESRYSPEVMADIQFKAPELLLLTGNYSAQIDIWSVGCVFAMMATKGNDFFTGDSRLSLLKNITEILGILTEEEWPGVTAASGWPNESQWDEESTVQTYDERLKSLKVAVPSLDSEGLDLLSQMLAYNPRNRITVKKALEHAYFKNHVKTLLTTHPGREKKSLSSCEEHLQFLIEKEEVLLAPILPPVLKKGRRSCTDWIFEMQAKASLRNSTVFLAVHTLDKYLRSTFSRNVGHETNWELLQVACLSISSKIEEIDFPSHLWRKCDFEENSKSLVDQIEEKSLLDMELKVLNELKWEIGWITPWHFMDLCATKLSFKKCEETKLMESFKLIIEEINTVAHRPSIIAAAAVILALKLDREELQYNVDPFLLLRIKKGQIDEILKVKKDEAPRSRRQCRKGSPHRAPFV